MVLISMVWIFVFFLTCLCHSRWTVSFFRSKAGCVLRSPIVFQHQTQCLTGGKHLLVVGCLIDALSAFCPLSLAWSMYPFFFPQDHPSPSWPSASPSLCSFYAVSPDRSYFPHRRSLGMVMPFPEHSLSLSASQLLFLLKDDPAFWDLTAPNYTSFLNRLAFAQLLILNWTLSWRNCVFYGWGYYLLLCW